MKKILLIALLFLAPRDLRRHRSRRRRLTFSALTLTTAAAARPVTHHTAAFTATATPETADPTSGNIALWGEEFQACTEKPSPPVRASTAVTLKFCRQRSLPGHRT